MTQFTRRAFTLSALAAVPALSACSGNGFNNNGGAKIDARVDATLAQMYSQFPQTRDLAQKSAGMLVMPLLTEAGLGVGGGYGRGALRVGGTTVDYYSATRANIGIQIGAQQYAHVLFFMTQEALQDFRLNDGWAAGADADIVFSNQGETIRAETTTALAPVVAVIFAHAGLRVGATIEGLKYSRIIP
ncbi:MAG: twin-arginine translocation pathway signal [Rhodobacteraceae bacterium]|nr:twin-arginine translocation pathway signal [Paracoccaceae bacterium]MBR9822041.1 twin-arginine translocation pathway signal [Paracoccaceae bacterium]